VTADKAYTLRRPLSFYEVIHAARLAVGEAYASTPDRAAGAVRLQALAMLPAYARDDVDGWTPRSEEDWVRKGAYCGLIDGWERAQWRGLQGPPTADGEIYVAAYTVAWSATTFEITRREAARAAMEARQ
jgi:hypothetical protein